jgi:hypothetical protein
VCNTVFTNNIAVGAIEDENTNTIGCRMKFLTTLPYNTSNFCQYAGATGGGRCGNPLDAVCDIGAAVCGTVSGSVYADANSCKATDGLKALENQWGYNQGASASTEDSLECRIYHVIASLTADLPAHCGHWNVTSAFCKDKVVPNVAHYCNTLDYNCGNNNGTGPTAQFGSRAQCMVWAAGLPNTGAEADARASNGANSLGCREYHAQAARGDSALHCSHAGPSGGGVCGSFFEAWTSLLKAAPCADTAQISDLVAAVGLIKANTLIPEMAAGATGKYNIAFDTSGNTQACRIYHLGVASTATDHCPHGFVSGGDSCGSYKSNLCAFIGGTCGFGATTWQFASKDACEAALTNSTTNVILAGVPGAASGGKDSYECRFYHATVAAGYMTGGINAAAANAATLKETHCSHVLKPAGKDGCGYVAKTSSATSLQALASVAVVAVSLFAL